MKSVTNTDKRITLDVAQSLLYYKSYPKVDKDWPTSGAYIFRPANTTVYALSDSVQISVMQVVHGTVYFVDNCSAWSSVFDDGMAAASAGHYAKHLHHASDR